MINKILLWLSRRDWFYNAAIRTIAARLVHKKESLTPQYIQSKGWVEEDGWWHKESVKQGYRVYIRFERNYYRIYLGERCTSPNKTYVSLESSREWFDMFDIMIHADNGRHELFWGYMSGKNKQAT